MSSFIADQKADESLAEWWKRAKEGNDQYLIANGILYRTPLPGCPSGHDKLLVLSLKYREQVLHQAHDSIWAAHAGIKRTKEIIFVS